MQPFACPNCQRLCHFEVEQCPACHAALGYDPQIDALRFLTDHATVWRDGAGGDAPVVRCSNADTFGVCNWLVPIADTTRLCRACRHNHLIPDLTAPGLPARWARVEAAKRRLFHTLIRLGLPLDSPIDDAGAHALKFDFLFDPVAEQDGPAQIMTGHDDGLITLNMIEADDARRERARVELGEPYRTLLGHLRHETGHHYWSVLVETDPVALAQVRDLFGDERLDYDEALRSHYARRDQGDWSERHVSFYATSHPWEDFAETFAHYLHIVDLLATVRGFDMSLAAYPSDRTAREIEVDFDPYTASGTLLARRMQPLSFAMNAFGRSLGQHDLYPFALLPGVIAKLDFIASLATRARRQASPPALTMPVHAC